jgi:hypothetical protein
MVDLRQSTKNQQGGKLMGIIKPIKNLEKQKKKRWKLLPIPAKSPTATGNQFPPRNKPVMANEKALLLVLGSNKNHLLCSQNPCSVCKMTTKN